MRESAGKAITRRLFFMECLPGWLSKERLVSGNFLLLLGDEPRELVHLDELGVPRDHVWSVENKYSVYKKQLVQDLRVSLYYGDMTEYLEHLLHGNQGFTVLNLDVEGSYLSQLDPAMTSVLLYCWRNPETVVATYSCIGRDTEMLWEGVKSLTFFLWLNGDTTVALLSWFKDRYGEFGFTHPTRMALRDFFWLRSTLEHSLIASTIIGATSQRVAAQLFANEELMWTKVKSRQKVSLRLSDLKMAVRDLPWEKPFILSPSTACLDLRIKAFKNVVYNAEYPWSQRCYFAKFEADEGLLSLQEWYLSACKQLVAEPFTYVNRQGQRRDVAKELVETQAQILLADNELIWTGIGLYRKFHPRRPPIRPAIPHLSAISQTVLVPRQKVEIKKKGEKTNDKVPESTTHLVGQEQGAYRGRQALTEEDSYRQIDDRRSTTVDSGVCGVAGAYFDSSHRGRPAATQVVKPRTNFQGEKKQMNNTLDRLIEIVKAVGGEVQAAFEELRKKAERTDQAEEKLEKIRQVLEGTVGPEQTTAPSLAPAAGPPPFREPSPGKPKKKTPDVGDVDVRKQVLWNLLRARVKGGKVYEDAQKKAMEKLGFNLRAGGRNQLKGFTAHLSGKLRGNSVFLLTEGGQNIAALNELSSLFSALDGREVTTSELLNEMKEAQARLVRMRADRGQ